MRNKPLHSQALNSVSDLREGISSYRLRIAFRRVAIPVWVLAMYLAFFVPGCTVKVQSRGLGGQGVGVDRPVPSGLGSETGSANSSPTPIPVTPLPTVTLAPTVTSGVPATPVATPQPLFDLDGDGQNDSDLNLTSQTAPSGLVTNYLSVTSANPAIGNFTIPFSQGQIYAPSNADPMGKGLGLIGKQFGGALQATYIYFFTVPDPNSPTTYLPSLYILDLNARALVAWVQPPANYSYYNTWFNFTVDSAGLKYPFLAPGASYVDVPHWNFLCIFDRSKIPPGVPDPACGTGFRSITMSFSLNGQPNADVSGGYRHNNGWVEGDFIHLPYLYGMTQTISRISGPVSTFQYDPSQTPPNSPIKWFHSGRQYGSFTPFTDSAGNHKVLTLAGDPVGAFQDYYCNVTRYVSVLNEDGSGGPASLAWSNYLSFVKDLFDTSAPYPDPANPNDILYPVLRYGDVMNLCVHRTGDSVLKLPNGNPITFYSFFTSDNGISNPCVMQQIAEDYFNFAPAYALQWQYCAQAYYLPVTGSWTIQLLNLSNGAGVNGWPNAYLWAKVDNFFPSGSPALFIETFSQHVPYNQAGYTSHTLCVTTVGADFTWGPCLPVPGASVPNMTTPLYAGMAVGSSNNGIPTAVTRANPNTGLSDVQLSDPPGTWVGFDPVSGSIKVR